MGSILVMSIFWTFYGILGLFGIQNIPKRYRNTEYEKSYKRVQGISWLLFGVPWFIVWLIFHNMAISKGTVVLILIACSIPSIVYTFIGDMRFRKKLNK